MRRAIALVFTAAALLMLGAVAAGIYNSEAFKAQQATAVEAPRFSMYECYDCGGLEPWEQAAGIAGLVAVAMSIGGAMLCAPEPRPPHRVSMLGLCAGAPRRAARPQRLDDDEGLTPLERVIRGY